MTNQEAAEMIRNDMKLHHDYLSGTYRKALNTAISALDAQEEIIHCRDCKYWQDQQEGVIEVPICARSESKYEKLPFRFMIGEDGFCSYAERRTDEGD